MWVCVAWAEVGWWWQFCCGQVGGRVSLFRPRVVCFFDLFVPMTVESSRRA